VTGTGFIIDNFSRACFPKSFCGGAICFYLWHIDFSFMLKCLIFVKIDGVSNDEFRLTPPEESFNWSHAQPALASVLKNI
jgi:hypothetical protein